MSGHLFGGKRLFFFCFSILCMLRNLDVSLSLAFCWGMESFCVLFRLGWMDNLFAVVSFRRTLRFIFFFFFCSTASGISHGCFCFLLPFFFGEREGGGGGLKGSLLFATYVRT